MRGRLTFTTLPFKVKMSKEERKYKSARNPHIKLMTNVTCKTMIQIISMCTTTLFYLHATISLNQANIMQSWKGDADSKCFHRFQRKTVSLAVLWAMPIPG